MSVHGTSVGGELDVARPAAAPAPGPAEIDVGELDRLVHDLRCVLAGQLDQVADQRRQLRDLRLHVVEDLGAVRLGQWRGAGTGRGGEQLEVGAHRGQRGAQLVPGVGDEPALLLLRRRERAEHVVEAAR